MTKDEAVAKARNVGVLGDPKFDEFIEGVVEQAKLMPPPGLWYGDEFEETKEAVALEADRHARASMFGQDGEEYTKPVVWEDLTEDERAAAAAMIDSPMDFLRELLAPFTTEAATASDERLQELYDEFEDKL